MKKFFIDTFKKPKRIGIAILFAIIVYVIIIILFNIQTLLSIASTLGISSMFQSLLLVIVFAHEAIHVYSTVMLVSISVLTGMNIALFSELIFQKRSHFKLAHSSKHGWSLIFAVLGIGCASCGTLIIAPLLSLLGIGALGFLPLAGGEFLLVSIILLLFSMRSLLKKGSDPLVCEV